MELGVTDRVFVVTGGSQGLGRAAAEALVSEGARVVLAARDPDQLTETATVLGGPDRAMAVPTDLADSGAVGRLVAAAVGRFGRVDGALLSVGGPEPGTALATTDDEWRAAFDSAFLGPLRVARAVAASIGDEGGALAFVLSSSVREPIDGLATSNGLRPGLAAVAKQLSGELAVRGIRVNGVLPGRFDTERVRQLDRAAGRLDAVRRRHEETIPLGRYGDPIEFGLLAAFLLSPAASYITGAMIPIDGGAAHGF